jgi:integrase
MFGEHSMVTFRMRDGTGSVDLRYLVEDMDRHGNVRIYVRRKGLKKVRLRETPGTAAFLEEYRNALAGQMIGSATEREGRGSFRGLCRLYFASTAFTSKDVSTQSWRRRALDSICEKHGHKPVALMRAKHVRSIRDERKDAPSAGNHRLKAMRAMFKWAIEEDHVEVDPTLGVQSIKYTSSGHHSWELEEVERYETFYPVGTKARLALDILLYTACRREDVVRLGPQHVRGGRLRYRQAKNEHRNPVDMDIPVHPDLQRSLDAMPSEHLTFLTTEFGKAFTANGFGNKFKDWCRQAGLAHCSAHGLRKAAAARLAERGATVYEIMAITGHQSLEEVERYTRAAQRKKLADSGMAKLKG